MQRRNGFTLVELLVVIGIISVLVAMLMPALNKARQAANTITCASNLRQIGMALAMYRNENHGYAYAEYTGGAAAWNSQSWETVLDRYLGANRNGIYKTEVISPVWACPVAHPDNYQSLHNGKPVLGTTCYAGNVFLYGTVSNYKPVKVTQIPNPEEIVDVCETRPGIMLAYPSSTFLTYEFWGHNGRQNILFVDGHVRQVLPTEPLASSTFKTSRPYWFYH